MKLFSYRELRDDVSCLAPSICPPLVLIMVRARASARGASDESPAAEARGRHPNTNRVPEGRYSSSDAQRRIPILIQNENGKTFEDEFLAFLKAAGVDYNPKFVFD